MTTHRKEIKAMPSQRGMFGHQLELVHVMTKIIFDIHFCKSKLTVARHQFLLSVRSVLSSKMVT